MVPSNREGRKLHQMEVTEGWGEGLASEPGSKMRRCCRRKTWRTGTQAKGTGLRDLLMQELSWLGGTHRGSHWGGKDEWKDGWGGGHWRRL